MPWPSNEPENSEVMDKINRDMAIMSWRNAKQTLDAAKENEMQMRKNLTNLLFPNPVKGTQRFNLGNGYSIKLVHKLNYKLDKDRVEQALDKIEAQGPKGELIAERLVKFTPELSQTEYKLLSEIDKKIIDEVLTVEPGAPTLELEEPK